MHKIVEFELDSTVHRIEYLLVLFFLLTRKINGSYMTLLEKQLIFCFSTETNLIMMKKRFIHTETQSQFFSEVEFVFFVLDFSDNFFLEKSVFFQILIVLFSLLLKTKTITAYSSFYIY